MEILFGIQDMFDKGAGAYMHEYACDRFFSQPGVRKIWKRIGGNAGLVERTQRNGWRCRTCGKTFLLDDLKKAEDHIEQEHPIDYEEILKIRKM